MIKKNIRINGFSRHLTQSESTSVMSVTTTTNPITSRATRYLDDYQIRLTGANQETTADPNSTSPPPAQNPEGWPSNYHDVPPMRPINRHLDREQRPDGQNAVEQAFIGVMLHGVWMMAVCPACPSCTLKLTSRQSVAQTWRKTGGRINDSFFRYAVGGEW
jgi:hypothetical protein